MNEPVAPRFNNVLCNTCLQFTLSIHRYKALLNPFSKESHATSTSPIHNSSCPYLYQISTSDGEYAAVTPLYHHFLSLQFFYYYLIVHAHRYTSMKPLGSRKLSFCKHICASNVLNTHFVCMSSN